MGQKQLVLRQQVSTSMTETFPFTLQQREHDGEGSVCVYLAMNTMEQVIYLYTVELLIVRERLQEKEFRIVELQSQLKASQGDIINLGTCISGFGTENDIQR